MDFSLKTSAVPGGTAAAIQLLQGIVAAGGLAAYLNACLAVALAADSAQAKAEGVAWLTSLQLDEMPLPALTEAIVQVNSITSTPGSGSATAALQLLNYISELLSSWHAHGARSWCGVPGDKCPE